MKIEIHVTLGISALFRPFKKHLQGCKSVRVRREPCDIEVSLIGHDGKPYTPKDMDALDKIAELWGESFESWLHNVIGIDIISQNMITDEHTELI